MVIISKILAGKQNSRLGRGVGDQNSTWSIRGLFYGTPAKKIAPSDLRPIQ